MEIKNLSTEEKKDLLFLHGYLSCGKSFSYQIPYFKKDFNVYVPDLKGFGENKGMEYPYSLDDYIEEVKNYIAEKGLKRPHVIAHSFGGRIALKMACKDRFAFDKIVLTDSAGLKPKRHFKYYLKTCTFKMLKPVFGKERLKRFYSKDYNALSSVMKESFNKIVNEHLNYTLPSIKNKTLIIFGAEDKETPVYMADELHKGISDSKKIIISGAGHFPFIDKPFKFNTEVREFLLSN